MSGDLHASEPELESGASVDRYRVLSRLGAGGMGVVYAAHDPQLDRRIALKVLRSRQMGTGARENLRERLVREAQAMARLSHPNVITIHDVGVVDGQVFLAMELVDGQTLAQWLETERSYREVARVFAEAGRGLAAAHDAGIVHRDFKPDNVLIGRSGRVRVTDFGLARPFGEVEMVRPGGVVDDGGDGRLTKTGTVMGTPAYMAPEQHLGEATDPRTDQFSFCVALWEALYKERPYPGETAMEVASAVTGGRLREPADRRGVPGWLHGIALRGLRVEPDDRFESMEHLLAELDDKRGSGRALVLPLLLVVVAAAAVVSLLLMRANNEADVCAAEGERAGGLLTPEARERISGEALPIFEGYAARLGARSMDACRATRARGEQSESLLRRRRSCYGAALAELAAAVRHVASAPAPAPEAAMAAAHGLPELWLCSDIEGLMAQYSLPTGPDVEPTLAATWSAIGDARVLARLGRVEASLRSAERAVAASRALDAPTVRASALLAQAIAQSLSKRHAAAESSLKQAVQLTARARADDLAARVWIAMIQVVAAAPGRAAEAVKLEAFARAAVARAGNRPVRRALLALRLGDAQRRAGDPEAARRSLIEARDLWTEVGADRPELIEVRRLLGLL